MNLLALLCSLLVPGTVTDLRVSAVTDTSVVLTWTEVSSGNTTVARYLIRYNFDSVTNSLAGPSLITGGCGAPVYGSLPAGGRERSCVLGGLHPFRAYAFQVIAYTGTLSSTNNFGQWSNRATATTAQRIGPMIVSRPPMFRDTVAIAAVSLEYDFGPTRFPVRGRFPFGDRVASFFDSTGALVAQGYMLLVRKP